VATLNDLVNQLLNAGSSQMAVCDINEPITEQPFEEMAIVVHKSSKKRGVMLQEPASSLVAAARNTPAQPQKKKKGIELLDIGKNDPAFNRFSPLTPQEEEYLTGLDTDIEPIETMQEKNDSMLEDNFNDYPDDVHLVLGPDNDMEAIDIDETTAQIQALKIRGVPESPASKGTGSAL
jgi:hypothetical protein